MSVDFKRAIIARTKVWQCSTKAASSKFVVVLNEMAEKESGDMTVDLT